MKTNILTLAITLTIGVILAGAVMVPVIKEATTTTEVVKNVGLYYITDDDESHTFSYDGTTYTIDGTALTSPGNDYTLLATDTELMRTSYQGLQLRGEQAGTASACNFTISNGTLSGTYTENSETKSLSLTYTDYVLATSTEESQIMKSYTSTAYLLKDSEIHGRGLTQLYTKEDQSTSAYKYIQIDGTIEDGVTVSIYDPDNSFSVSNIKINTTSTEGYADLYTFVSITFDVTHTATTAVTSCTYTAVIVPAQVTAELAEHLDGGSIALLNALPIMVIVALLMAAVGAIALRRAD